MTAGAEEQSRPPWPSLLVLENRGRDATFPPQKERQVQRKLRETQAVMADFRTHVTTSTVLGIGYAGVGILAGAPVDSSLVAGGLCGIAGMLPDLDSDRGRPLRELMAFAAAVVPMLMIDRFEALQMSHETMVLAGGAVYLVIRFGVSAWLRYYTVHRGMFHSIPAALIFAELTFLVSGCTDLNMRYLKAGGVLLGFMSHLVLDELYSFQFRGGRFRLKRSFGTAIKLWGPSLSGNLSVYIKLILVTAAILGEPAVMSRLGAPPQQDVYRTANGVWQEILRR